MVPYKHVVVLERVKENRMRLGDGGGYSPRDPRIKLYCMVCVRSYLSHIQKKKERKEKKQETKTRKYWSKDILDTYMKNKSL